jgi:indole-3-glycerol phosphate synthase
MSFLDAIVRDKRAELEERRGAVPRASLEARCRPLPPPRDLEEALRPRAGGVRLIAEVKKASPSRGVLAAALDPVALARQYARHGADAISVLTDAKYFQGSLETLTAIRGAVQVPLIRKDFMLDEYQLWEARAAGADAVLLIVAILAPTQLRELLQAAKGLGLGALVECHRAAEVEVALGAGARIVGINNRDLHTFETRLETTLELLPLIPPGPIVVSESGFFGEADVRRVVAAGAHAVLVGEGLVTAPDIAAKIAELTLKNVPTGKAGSPPAEGGGDRRARRRPDGKPDNPPAEGGADRRARRRPDGKSA